MKIFSIISLTILISLSAAHAAEEDILSEYTNTSLKDQLYVVDSSELDPTESLNRVSGNIDLGFSGSDSSYQSVSHYMAGPFGQQDQLD